MTYEPVRQTQLTNKYRSFSAANSWFWMWIFAVCSSLNTSYFCFMLSAVEAAFRSPHPVRAQRSEWPHCFPRKEQYCPRSPVNWLITSLMRVEQPATMATLSDSQVTSEPKTRTCLIWENGLGADKIPEHGAAGENGPLMDGNH